VQMSRRLLFTSALLLTISAAFGAESKDTEQVLYRFAGGSDGDQPGSLIRGPEGNLYGVTLSGGNLGCQSGFGCGTVFKVSPQGRKTTLYAFNKGDGNQPSGTLLINPDGKLYGTTDFGGTHDQGVVFNVVGTHESVMYSFTGGSDGGIPQQDRLVEDESGSIYGTASAGGDLSCIAPIGCGVVFKLTSTGHETVLHQFHGGSDGADPLGGLRRDANGDLYGVTVQGGGGSHCARGCGTIFNVTPEGTETVLYAFSGGSDGNFAETPPVIDSETGTLYGTTAEGGVTSQNCPQGCGVIYALAKDGTYTVLHAFTGGSDGAYPELGLRIGKHGNLFGVTETGGTFNGGTVYRLAPDGTLLTQHDFTGGDDGLNPFGRLANGRDGYLYGTTLWGGGSS